MESTRRNLLGTATGALAIALAGCTGDSNDTDRSPTGTPTPTDQSGTPTETSTPTATQTTTQDGSAATVRTRSHPDHGTILVDADGMTLYMFDSDTQGEGASTCTDGCASAWPPLTVDGTPTKGSGVEADLGTFERDGGETQVSAGGWPLYYYDSDAEPGDAKGQGVNDAWWVLDADGTPKR